MMLMHPTLERPIIFDDSVNVLIIENKDQLADYITMLNSQIRGNDGAFVLSNEGKCLNISNCIKIIVDPFNLDINVKEVLTQVYISLNKIAMDEDHYCVTNEVMHSFLNYIAKLLVDADIEVDIKDCSMSDVIKLFSPKFIPSDDLLLMITDYLNIMSRYSKCVLFVFVNLHTLLSKEKLSLLKQHILYHKYCVLFIESSAYQYENDENVVIIDENLCEIR